MVTRVALCLWLTTCGGLAEQARAGAPEPLAAVRALVRTPFTTTGDLVGGTGLITASLIATLGDTLRLADDNRVSRGVASGTVRRAALVVSAASTTALEWLRWEDIERLPEAREAYVTAAPFVGRLDTALSGTSAIGLAVRDLASGPPLSLLHLVGANEAAVRLRQWQRERRIAALGPEPLPPH